jgi:dolichol-phosphate mannosyltransferase
MKILVVIPCRNESNNLSGVINSLSEQGTNFVKYVTIVENNSTDSTFEIATNFARKSRNYNFEIDALQYSHRGNLSSAVELAAFLYGSQLALTKFKDVTHIMKLDADIRLDKNYFFDLLSSNLDFDLTGGKLDSEQVSNIPGCVKLYSIDAFKLLLNFPVALGWDILDEVMIRQNGMKVVYCREAKYQISRTTGSSEGLLPGRKRLGLACKVTGYSRIYFGLKFTRFLFRKPYVIGSFAMLAGYLSRQTSPFTESLIQAYRTEQKEKLLGLLKNPVVWIQESYNL